MRARLSDTLQIPFQRIGIKATTNERLGFIGRGEGISAMAVASIQQLEPKLVTEPTANVA
jgi:2-C-methyl-D-erythritol 2,4-cyclodiphosphate synthase